MRGLIVKAGRSIYTVESENGPVDCRVRGRLRLGEMTPVAGDFAEITCEKDGGGVITDILRRKNFLARPPVANIDKLIIIASAATPVTAMDFIDFLTALSGYKGITPIICVNKADIAGGGDIAALYRSAGYCAFETSAVTGLGIDRLLSELDGCKSVFTGNSGVGKSSILNALNRDFDAETGDLSEKIGRGRQTTRRVEFHPVGKNGYIADTPGYSAYDAVRMEMTDPERLPRCFPEFTPYLGKCRYGDCGHVKDDGCAIRAAVEKGLIAVSRHESYIRLRGELTDAKKTYGDSQKTGKTI